MAKIFRTNKLSLSGYDISIDPSDTTGLLRHDGTWATNYVTTGQTGAFVTTGQTGVYENADRLDNQHGVYYLNYANMTGSISGTGSFVTTGQTGVYENADRLDGQHGAYYLNYGNMTGSISGTGSFITTGQTGNFASTGWVESNYVGWSDTGTLDADKLDGQHGSYYRDGTNITGTLNAGTLDGFDSTYFVYTGDSRTLSLIGFNELAKFGHKLENMYYYPNVAAISLGEPPVGAFVFNTPVDRLTPTMFGIRIRGYAYNISKVVDFSVFGYCESNPGATGNIDGLTGCVQSFAVIDQGNDGYSKWIGINKSGKVAVAVGTTGLSGYFHRYVADAWLTMNYITSLTTGLWGWTNESGTNFGFKDLRAAVADVYIDSSKKLNISVVTGTAPLVVNSNTVVSNLNSDYLDGQHGAYYRDGTNITGTLDADTLDGQHGAYYLNYGNMTGAITTNRNITAGPTGAGAFSGMLQIIPSDRYCYIACSSNGSGRSYIIMDASGGATFFDGDESWIFRNSIAGTGLSILYLRHDRNIEVYGQVQSSYTGGAPFTVASTTLVTNLNSDLLDSQHGAYYRDGANITGTISATVTNADQLDSQHGSYYLNAANMTGTLNTAVTVDADTFSGQSSSYYRNYGNLTGGPIWTVGAVTVGMTGTAMYSSSGNIILNSADDVNKIYFRSGNTVKTQILANVNNGNVNWDSIGSIDFRNVIDGGASTLTIYTGGHVRISGQIQSLYSTGAPFSVSSSTVVTNLNADYLDGQHGAYYRDGVNITGNVAADTLDGQHGAYYRDGVNITGNVAADTLDGQHGAYYRDGANLTGTITASNADTLDGQHGAYYRDGANLTGTITASNSDTLDSQHGIYYLNYANMTGGPISTPNSVTVGPTGTGPFSGNIYLIATDRFPYLIFRSNASAKSQIIVDTSGGSAYWDAFSWSFRNAPDSGATVMSITNAGTILLSGQFQSLYTGGPPFTVTSTGLVTNLNSDLLDNQHGSYYRDGANITGTISATVSNADTLDTFHSTYFAYTGDSRVLSHIGFNEFSKFGQKLENMYYYPNVASISLADPPVGAFVFNTPIARLVPTMFGIRVRGYAYNTEKVTEFSIVGYCESNAGATGNIDGLTGCVRHYAITDVGNDGLAKWVGINKSGYVAVAIGTTGTSGYFHRYVADAWLTMNYVTSLTTGLWAWSNESGADFSFKDLRPAVADFYVDSSKRFNIPVVTGAAPLVVNSNTLVSNFNSDYLDNQHGAYYLNYGNFTGGYIQTPNAAYFGPTGAGTFSGRIQLYPSDRYNCIIFTSGALIPKVQLIGEVSGGNFFIDVLGDVIVRNIPDVGAVTHRFYNNGNTWSSGQLQIGYNGGAPMTVVNSTAVTNLNSDYLDGQHGSYYRDGANITGTISATVTGSDTLDGQHGAYYLNYANMTGTMSGTGAFVTTGDSRNLSLLGYHELAKFGQKLESTYYYPNVASYVYNDYKSGAFVFNTPFSRSGACVFKIHIEGFYFGTTKIVDFYVAGYANSNAGVTGNIDGVTGKTNYLSCTDNGNDGQPKWVGINKSGMVAVVIGNTGDYNYLPRFVASVWATFGVAATGFQANTWAWSCETGTNFEFKDLTRITGYNYTNSVGQLVNILPVGTAPFSITSTTLNTNLNSDLLDNQHGPYYNNAVNMTGILPYGPITGRVNNYYIAYSDYVSFHNFETITNYPYFSEMSNRFFSAPSRFTVTGSGLSAFTPAKLFDNYYDQYGQNTIAANGTGIINIILTGSKGAVSASGISYTEGTLYVSFYCDNVTYLTPQSVSGRMKVVDAGGTWIGLTPTNLSTSVYNSVWALTVPYDNYGTEFEIRVVATATGGAFTEVNQIEYKMLRPFSLLAAPYISKFRDESYYNNLTFKDSNNLSRITLNSANGSVTLSGQLISQAVPGVAPFTMVSTTVNSNLNSDLLDDQHGAYYRNATNITGSIVNSLNSNVGSQILAGASGITVTVPNAGTVLAAISQAPDSDLLDNQHGAYYRNMVNATGTLPSASLVGAYTSVTGLGTLGTLAVSTTSLVTNLNADYLDSQHGSYYRDGANITGTISATVSNADQLDSQHGSYYRDGANITGTVSYASSASNANYATDSDTLDSQHGAYYRNGGNITGNIINSLNSNVGAQVLAGASGISITVPNAGTVLAAISQAPDSDLLDSQHGAYYRNGGNITGNIVNTFCSLIGNTYIKGTDGVTTSTTSQTIYIHGGTPSDKRIKMGVKPFVDGGAILDKLPIVEWKFNGKADTIEGARGIGVVAQEVVDTIPYCVSSRKVKLDKDDQEDTDLFFINNSSLVWVLVNAVKELRQENIKLSQRIDKLEKWTNCS